MISSEIYPLAKTGGLADMVSALARTLLRCGTPVTLVTPAYRSTLEAFPEIQEAGVEFTIPIANRHVPAQILKTSLAENLAVYLIQGSDYFTRAGLYGTAAGDYPDNAERFVFFTKAALALAQEAVLRGVDDALEPAWRNFLYMPYIHSESALIHKEAVRVCSKAGEQTYDFELRHKAIIDRFGRYPHRNAILGRQSTPEEIEFLKQPGSSF